MVQVIMMVFITRCLKRLRPDWFASLFVVALFLGVTQFVHAQNSSLASPVLNFQREDNALWLSTQLKFDLPQVVEDAMMKGVPMYFVAEAEVLRERWYWTNLKFSSVQRRMRLAYHPLTRRWRLNVSAGEVSETSQGIALNQNFDRLEDAMDQIRRISHWRLVDLSDLERGVPHLVEFRFRLDLTQLPRPLQIGTLGQTDWQIVLYAKQELAGEADR
jgi:hypothetical protein